MPRLAEGLERASEHPLAAAIVTGAEGRGLKPSDAENFRSMTDRGVRGRVGGRAVSIGNAGLAGEAGNWARELADRAEALRRDGQTVVFVTIDENRPGCWGSPTRPSLRRPMRSTGCIGMASASSC